MEYSNCFEVHGSSWADACEDDDFPVLKLPVIPVPVEQPKPKIKKKTQVKKPVPEPVKQPRNVFSVLDSDTDESETEEQTHENVSDVGTVSSMVPQLDEPPVFKEEENGDDSGWKTVTKTKKGKKVIDEGSKIIICKNRWCKKQFVFTVDEQVYFAEKGWPDRTKCKECKKEQKNREQFGRMPRVNRKKTIQLD